CRRATHPTPSGRHAARGAPTAPALLRAVADVTSVSTPDAPDHAVLRALALLPRAVGPGHPAGVPPPAADAGTRRRGTGRGIPLRDLHTRVPPRLPHSVAHRHRPRRHR